MPSAPSSKPKGLFILGESMFPVIYGPQEQAAILELVDITQPVLSQHAVRQRPDLLADVEVILSGWGAPKLDDAFLRAAPKLKAFFYGAGSVRGFVTDAFWEREILLTSARAANAVAVAEYCLACILFGLKRGWALARWCRENQRIPPPDEQHTPGNFGTTVGLISLGATARRLIGLLRAFDHRLIAYDPMVTDAEAATLGVELVSLEEVFQKSHAVSVHVPWLKETEQMIRGHHLRLLRRDALLINSARGAVIHEEEMIAVLRERPDLQAILDVSHPEPPTSQSPLYSLPNVVYTPHIAGTKDEECRRMGQLMVSELRRYLRGQPLEWAISPKQAAVLA